MQKPELPVAGRITCNRMQRLTPAQVCSCMVASDFYFRAMLMRTISLRLPFLQNLLASNLLLTISLLPAQANAEHADAKQPSPATLTSQQTVATEALLPQQQGKIVIYQAFTRLFGNSNPTNQPWASAAVNGVGKFNDFNDAALQALRELGVSHLWLTGVPHHALIADYSAIGISADDPDVVKGRAGSPYAVKDYYSVNPDLAVDPAKRMDEFKALLQRAHRHGLQVLIDIVPNHVARHYRSTGKPAGVQDFGALDDTTVEYARDNNFYYVPGQPFQVPDSPAGYQPLGGAPHPLADGRFTEIPAKWTGNGARKAKPDFNDWFETVKINYGVRPDGSYDFARLPKGFATASYQQHLAFWQQQDVPDSWQKFRDITQFWLDIGVDGFRYDMAEMVPVEFWSYLNSQIKARRPDALLLAEVYQPALYQDYLQLGKMDFLYDKVGFYDSLRLVMQGKAPATDLMKRRAETASFSQHMLKFLENHDEQRLAHPAFAGHAQLGIPAMTVASLIDDAPVMLYFGQEVGEQALLDSGFGDPSRTSIFDYTQVPAHARWVNHGRYDGGQLSAGEQQLRQVYQRLLQFVQRETTAKLAFVDLHQLNLTTPGYSEQQFSFARSNGQYHYLVVANFANQPRSFKLALPPALQQPAAQYAWQDWFTGQRFHQSADNKLPVQLPAYGVLLLRVQPAGT